MAPNGKRTPSPGSPRASVTPISTRLKVSRQQAGGPGDSNRAREAPPPRRRLPLGLPQLLLFGVAALALSSQAMLWFNIPPAVPSMIALGALGLAGLSIAIPALKRTVTRLVVPVGASVPLVALGYGMTGVGFPLEVLFVVLPATVVGAALLARGAALVPLAGATATAAGYALATTVAGASWVELSPHLLGALAATGLLMSAGALQVRTARRNLDREAARIAAEARRIESSRAAMRADTEAAAGVLEVATAIATALDPRVVADQIVRGAAAQAHASGVILLLWDEAMATFRVGAIHGAYAAGATDLRQIEIRPDTMPSIDAFAGSEVVELAAGTVQEAMLQSLLQRWRTRRLLGVRLSRGERLRGLMLVAFTERGGRAGDADEWILSGIAAHAAAALDHASLVADLRLGNQLKEEFMATMSHELRTPLNVIIGYTDLQLEGAFGELGEEHVEVLGTTRRQATQLLDLIQATLDMSRLERGLMTVEVGVVTIAELFKNLQAQILPGWRKRSVEMNWCIAPGLPAFRTDADKLEILLRNLIHNALKFTDQGMVTVSASNRGDRQQLTFVVQDSGIGIKAEHLSSIFEMFRQIHDPNSSIGGVGLGLYIVKRLAAVLAAEIEVSSAPGRGTTFRVHVPMAGPLATRSK